MLTTRNSAQSYVAAWMGGVWGRMDTCICMAESLHYSPETITILLIDYTPIQNKKLKKTQLSAVQSMKKNRVYILCSESIHLVQLLQKSTLGKKNVTFKEVYTRQIHMYIHTHLHKCKCTHTHTAYLLTQ